MLEEAVQVVPLGDPAIKVGGLHHSRNPDRVLVNVFVAPPAISPCGLGIFNLEGNSGGGRRRGCASTVHLKGRGRKTREGVPVGSSKRNKKTERKKKNEKKKRPVHRRISQLPYCGGRLSVEGSDHSFILSFFS